MPSNGPPFSAKCLEKGTITQTNISEDPDIVRGAFDGLLAGVHKAVKDSSDREEMNILG